MTTLWARSFFALAALLICDSLVLGQIPTPTFRRGDLDGNGQIELIDVTATLSILFVGGSTPCEDAVDVDDDGQISLPDVIRLLDHLFVSNAPIATPGTRCGVDPTPDGLSCATAVGVCPSVLGESRFGSRVHERGFGSMRTTWGDLDGDGLPELLFAAERGRLAWNLGGLEFESTDTPFGDGGLVTHTFDAEDLDNDGDLDLLIVVIGVGPNGAYFELQTRLNLGNGAFDSPAAYPGDCSWPTVGDFNGDGTPDLIYLSDLPASILDPPASVRLGTGSGAFGPPTVVAMSVDENGPPLVADFNGDSRDDLALISAPNPSSLRIFLADVAGGFLNPTFVQANASGGVNAGDFDGDGDIDLLIAGAAALEVRRNDGLGNFTTFTGGSVPGSSSVRHTAVGDLDGDGDLDVVGARSNAVGQVFLNDGSGVLSAASPFPIDQEASGVDLADADGDGDLDVVFGRWAESDLVLEGLGDGTFRTATDLGVLPSVVESFAVDVGDDGTLDVVTVTQDGDLQLSTLTGPGMLVAGISATLAVSSIYHADMGDIDGDGLPDLVASSGAPSGIFIAYGDPVGGFGPAVPTGIPGGLDVGVDLADVDGDGILDLLDSAPAQVNVRIGHGAGSFTLIGSLPAVSNESLAFGDIDNDGDVDVMCADGVSQVAVFLNDGFGSFASGVALSLLPFITSGPQDDYALADFTGDGNLDLLRVGGVEELLVWTGFGTGNFGPPLTPLSDVPSDHRQLTIGDFDSDGDLDVAAPSLDDSFVRVWWGAGNGTFPETSAHSVEAASARAVALDVDDDGDLDLVVNGSRLLVNPFVP